MKKIIDRVHHHAVKPKIVTVTGGSGKLAYSLLFRLANGELFDKSTPLHLHLYDKAGKEDALKAIKDELEECSFENLCEVNITTNLTEAFKDTEYAFLLSGHNLLDDHDRTEQLKKNGKIYRDHGKAIGDNAQRNCKTVVVANPSNTMCLVCASNASDMDEENFTSLNRLDLNRALYQISKKAHCKISEIEHLAIWGNHSPTVYADTRILKVKGKLSSGLLDENWLKNDFNPYMFAGGADIKEIHQKEDKSAASSASAVIDHMRDWVHGSHHRWVTMGIPTDGEEYGIPKGLVFAMPLVTHKGSYAVVPDLEFNDEYSKKKIQANIDELVKERELAAEFLK